MSDGLVSDHPAPQFAAVAQLDRVCTAARVRSFHGTFLCLSETEPRLAHAFRPAPADMVVVLRPMHSDRFALLLAERAVPLRDGEPAERLHLVRLVPASTANHSMLCDPIGQDCLLARQDWHSNKGGPIELGPVEQGLDRLFSLDATAMPPITDPAMLSEITALMGMMDAFEGDGDPAAATSDRPRTRLTEVLRAAMGAPHPDHAHPVAPTHSPSQLAGGEWFVPIGRFERTLPSDPERIDPNCLAGGWTTHLSPNFGTAEADRTSSVFATGRRATVSFELPFRPKQARFRLRIANVAMETTMVVSTDGWELGRSSIGHWGATQKRLDFIIKEEAIQSDRLLIEIAVGHSPDAPGRRRLFRLVECRLDLGPEVPPVQVPQDPAVLLNAFESIGVNCEFGFLQRHFGVERLGILTFAGVKHSTDLLNLLDSGFAELGTPGSIDAQERTFSVRNRNEPPRTIREFWITNHRYQFEMHTFKGSEHHDRDQAIRESQMKLRYLSRKFVEDLEDAAKILVFKDIAHTGLNDILSLHASLNRYGPNKLFWVTHPVPGRPAGSVEWIAPNLLRGYSFNPHHDVQWFNPDHWLLLCRRAYAAFGQAG